MRFRRCSRGTSRWRRLVLVAGSLASVGATAAVADAPALRPAEVLGNLECRMLAGRGAASGSALVVLPSETGARFSVVDGRGTVVADTVPFMPRQLRLGKRKDGTPVVGLGDLRRHPGNARPVDPSGQVRIYLGDDAVHDSDSAWDFIVARDGSSFAVHEALPGDASRLLVHDLELGSERRVELENRLTPMNAFEPSYVLGYTLDATEIMFEPGCCDTGGLGAYWFHAIEGGATRRISFERGMSAVIISSREGVFVDRPEDLEPDERENLWRVSRRRFDAGEGTAEAVWSRSLDLDSFSGTVFLSDNGRWLGVYGWNFHALDAETGDTVFRYSRVAYPLQQLPRLVSVLGADASPSDVGRLGHITFRGDSMMFFRSFGQVDCRTLAGEEFDEIRYRKCLRHQRNAGTYRTVYDVYDMRTITLDAQPSYRAEVYRETDCMEGDVPFRGLQSVDGRLTYLTTTR